MPEKSTARHSAPLILVHGFLESGILDSSKTSSFPWRNRQREREDFCRKPAWVFNPRNTCTGLPLFLPVFRQRDSRFPRIFFLFPTNGASNLCYVYVGSEVVIIDLLYMTLYNTWCVDRSLLVLGNRGPADLHVLMFGGSTSDPHQHDNYCPSYFAYICGKNYMKKA